MTSFGKYVSNFVKTAVSSISPNKVIPYTISQYESEYEDCDELLNQKSIYYFYKVANHFDMVYLPGSVDIPGSGETVYAYSLFRFQGEEESGVVLFSRYVDVLDPLHLACLKMGLSIDRTQLERITSYCRNQSGWGAAHVAAAMSWREMFLSESISNLLNAYDPLSGLTPLRVAIKENDEETVRYLVSLDNIKADEKDEDGNTVLHLASGGVSSKVLSLLLENLKSLNANALNNKGESPLHIACRNNSLECIEKLLRAGSNPMIGEFESYAIHIAVNNDSLECVNLLYTYCPNCINLPDLMHHSTPIHLVHNPKIFERLCELGANLDARNDMGLTTLHMKVRDNNFEDVLALLIRGADPNLCDISGATPLHYAMIYNSSIHVVRALLAFEADPHAVNNNQQSCRHLLCCDADSYVHSPDRDLALYTLDALGTSRCPPGTENCTGGCMDLESAERCNLSVFNGTPPEVVHHLADLARESVEEILLSCTSLDSNYSRQINQTLRSAGNNDLSNLYTRVNGVPPRTFSSYPENCNLNNDFTKQEKPRKKTSKLQRRNSHHSKLNRQIEPSSHSSVQMASFSIPSDSEIELNSNSYSNEQLDNSKFTSVINNSQQSSDNTNPIKIHLQPEAATFKFKPTQCTCDRSVFTRRTGIPMDLDISPTTKVTTTCSTVPIATDDIDLSNNETKEYNKNVEKNELSDSNTGDDDCDDVADDDIHCEFRNIERHRIKRSRKWRSGPNGLRILSLDGGGMRGLVIVQLLRALEIASGKKITELFDWIVGTSTGAAISLFIISGKCLHCCRTLLFRFKDLVFRGKRPYPPEPLEMLMREEFGNDTVMTDLKTVRVAVTTLVSDRCPPMLHMFRNYKSPRVRIQEIIETRQSGSKSSDYPSTYKRENSIGHRRSTSSVYELEREIQSPKSQSLSTSQSILNFFVNAQGFLSGSETNANISTSETELNVQFEHMPLDNEYPVWKAARASSAAPTYFRPCGRFLDGGLISNNPTLDILTEVQELHLLQRLKKKPITPIAVVVSLGTGRMPVMPVETVDVFRPQNIMETYRSVRGFGFLGRILVEIATMSDGRVVDRASAWCGSLGVPFFRLSPPLSIDFNLDCTDTKELLLMIVETQTYLHRVHERIELLASLL
ncbi:hypothetical protein MN116_001878 [Schistosoma mekongi]|uniref:phospholipase A2 n=1 Tax=Schistosoma mekongi TaxID=38744 RepID=A0AAE1ZJQ9_SCHME|nr:hypothetical protein MN116_001878 [Schistosoma mekongi]